MERIEEFKLGDKDFIYFDMSNMQDNDEIMSLITEAKETVIKYPEHSLYTITNLANLAFDSKTKEITSEWIAFNRPYVIYGTVIGLDGIRKIMFNAVLKLSGRKNMKIFTDKKQATDWLNSI